MNKYNTYIKYVALTCAVWLMIPAMTSAATKVSQDFSGEFLYFHYLGTPANLLYENGWFASDRPDIAQPWSRLDGDFDPDSKLSDGTFQLNMGNAVTYGDNDYFIMHGGLDPNGMSFDPTSLEVWRSTENSTMRAERVLELSTNFSEQPLDTSYREAYELVVLNNALILVMTNGELWRTKNGTDWKEIQVTNWYGNAWDQYPVTATSKRMMLARDNKVFMSKNGKQWKQLKAPFSKQNIGTVLSLASYDDQFYALVVNANQNYVVWRKNEKGSQKRWTKMYESADELSRLFGDVNGLYVDAGIDEQVLKYSGDTFKTVMTESDPFIVRGIDVVRGKTLLHVLHEDGTSALYRIDE